MATIFCDPYDSAEEYSGFLNIFRSDRRVGACGMAIEKAREMPMSSDLVRMRTWNSVLTESHSVTALQ